MFNGIFVLLILIYNIYIYIFIFFSTWNYISSCLCNFISPGIQPLFSVVKKTNMVKYTVAVVISDAASVCTDK